MQNKLPLKLKQTDSQIVLNYNGTPFIKVSKAVLKDFLADSSSSIGIEVEEVKTKKRKKKGKKVEVDKDVVKKANQLAKLYTTMKKKFYKSKVMKGISPNTKDFEHIMKAVVIINRHGVTLKTFMKAQVAGLEFAGTFPKVTQLSTDNAEVRLFEYQRKKNMKVELTDHERGMELMQNKKYKINHGKVEDGTATLFEAMYVKECQLARRGEVQPMVQKYIKKMKKKL